MSDQFQSHHDPQHDLSGVGEQSSRWDRAHEDAAFMGPDEFGTKFEVDGVSGSYPLEYGTPNRDGIYWEPESANGLCGDTSISMVIEQLTGRIVSPAQVEQVAESIGLQPQTAIGSSTEGLEAPNVASLLDEFGLSANVETGSLSTLEEALENGQGVIAGVAADDLWSWDNTGEAANHAVVVTGIEFNSQGVGYVTMNDPGQLLGHEYTVPLSVFEEAWHASGDSMIVTTAGTGPQPDIGSFPEESRPVESWPPSSPPDSKTTGVTTGEPSSSGGWISDAEFAAGALGVVILLPIVLKAVRERLH